MASTLGNRLAGLPKINKIAKKKPTPVTRSPPKPTPAALPFPLNPSDDDTLSEPDSSSLSSSSSSSSSEDSDSDDDVVIVTPAASTSKPHPSPPKKPTTAKPKPKPSKTTKPTSSKPLPVLSSSMLPPLPPLPPLPSFPIASTSTTPYASNSKPSTSRPKPPKPSTTTSSTSSSSARPKPGIMAPSDLAYSPSSSVSRSNNAPQRMSLRQVLALSLQEAETSSSRENTPDASEISQAARGAGASARKLSGGGGISSDSSLSEVSSDESESDGHGIGIELDEAGEVGSMEREEERLLRAEIERRKSKGKQVANFRGGEDSEDDREGDEEDTDSEEDEDEEEDLMGAWERNVRAMETIRRKQTPFEGGKGRGGGGGGVGNTPFVGKSEGGGGGSGDGDSDIAVTELPPGNGFGVVTWSDYDSFGSDEEEEEESEEDQLAEVLEAQEAGLAGEFEEELEQLFALSEAVVGPIRQDEYHDGDMWFEALSDLDGSTADDENEGREEDDIDAEMIFGENGELKRLFGRRKTRRQSAIDSSAGETDSEEDDETGSEEGEDVELVRVGVHLDDEEKGEAGSDGEETASYHSEDEETDSSCSDTDIYRYAPRTGALANLQAPTTADLASLDPSPSNPKPPFAPGRSAPSTLAVPTFHHSSKGKKKTELPTFKRRLPTMGTFDTTERKEQSKEGGLSVVVVGAGEEIAPSPFRVPFKKVKRRVVPPTSPRRVRSDSRVSTTSGTSGSMSLDQGSTIGSPVLGNVVLPPTFNFDSLLQESLFEATDSEEQELLEALLVDGATSSETDTGGAATTSTTSTTKAPPALDFSRWNRIPIGAFRTRTMGGNGGNAPSQVLTAQAAATEHRNNKRKKRQRSMSTSSIGTSSSKKPHPQLASSILRDHKSIKTSLRHTLGSPAPPSIKQRKKGGGGGGGQSTNKGGKSIRSRMLTSPVLAPTVLVPSEKRPRSKSPGIKSAKSSRIGSSRRNSLAPHSQPPPSSSTLTAPTANLPPLHSPLFSKLNLPAV